MELICKYLLPRHLLPRPSGRGIKKKIWALAQNDNK